MFIYENGIKKSISFKNTYASTYINDKETLLFAKPFYNELYGIAIEKGYAVSQCINNNMEYGYKKIEGGSGYKVFETLLGAECEKFTSKKKYENPYKLINKENLKYKIKKYIDFGGFITFGVFYSKNKGHEYSLQGYKIDKNGDLLIEIINPHRSGNYTIENIYLNKNKDKDKLIDNEYPVTL